MGALDRTRSRLTVHHLILIRGGRGKGQGGIIQFRFGSFIKSCQTDQTGARRAGIRGRSEGGARLILLSLVETDPCADGAALSRRGQRTHTGNTRTRHMRAHHSTVLGTQTRKLRVTITPSHSWLQSYGNGKSTGAGVSGLNLSKM